ncbi:MAG: polymer-forming cytoskeletal protein [Halieaceae bacterium]|jgi:cytoskeletal protein CcmA (bactofilin family)|nr:polymer-forming cytoskeletal protein [Halieaceae bacterium]
MLGSKKSSVSVSGKTTLISSDTVILGDIRFSGVLDIEGLVQGNIVAQPGKDAMVRVVDKGRVEGEIHAPAVVINGAVEGNVHSTKHLELASRARVKGNVFYTLVEMAAGAEVNGALTHVAENGTAKEQKKSSAAAGAGPGDHPAGLAVVSAKLD